MALTNAQMLAIIDGGGNVIFNGTTYNTTNRASVPSDAEIARINFLADAAQGGTTIPTVTLAADSAYHALATLQFGGAAAGREIPAIVTVTGTVGGTGPLTGLKLTVAAKVGGTHVNRLVDADFNTATRFMPFSSSNPHTTATGNSFQFAFDATGIAEITLWAKTAAGATVALEISY